MTLFPYVFSLLISFGLWFSWCTTAYPHSHHKCPRKGIPHTPNALFKCWVLPELGNSLGEWPFPRGGPCQGLFPQWTGENQKNGDKCPSQLCREWQHVRGTLTQQSSVIELIVQVCGKVKLGREQRTWMDVFSCKEGQRNKVWRRQR